MPMELVYHWHVLPPGETLTMAIASYGKEMFGMIIESEEITRAQKAIFELESW